MQEQLSLTYLPLERKTFFEKILNMNDKNLQIDELMNVIEADAEHRFTRVSEIDKRLLFESEIPTNTRKKKSMGF